MIKNYFKVAVRNLLRYKGFSFINILSLSIGILGCLVIGLFVWDEKQFDNFIPDGENIYRLYDKHNSNNTITYGASVPPAYATFLKQQYPEVATSARILMTGDKFLMENSDKKGYESKGWIVDSTFFQIFPIKFLRGDMNTALNHPSSIIISEDLAKRYFGNDDPIGKTVKIDKGDMTVKGVFAELPSKFHLSFNYLMPMSAAGFPKERMEKWTWHQFYTYVKVKPGTNAQLLQDKFQAQAKKYATIEDAGSNVVPFFQSLKDIHLKSSDFVYDVAIRGNDTYVKALSIIAFFVLVIACFNFVNLSTARSFRRAKEIGVRKVIGADRKQLIIQFIGETILLSVLSMILAGIATFFIVPALNEFTGKDIEFNLFTNPLLLLIILVAGILIGVLAGIYPALILSGFQPIKVLKNMKLVGSGGTAWLRHTLVVIQFSLSVLLIVSAIIVFRQTEYMNNKDLGFDKEQVVYFQLRDSLASNPQTLETFKSELRTLPNVVAVTSGYGLPGDAFAGESIVLPSRDSKKRIASNLFIVDHDYVKTLGLRILAGRDFSREMSTDVTQAFIINETAVKQWGLGTPEKAIGEIIHWDEWAPLDSTQPVKKGKVIGVIQDFHPKSLHEKITPAALHLYPQVTYTATIKIKGANVQNTLTSITSKWNQFVPAYPIDYKFMDESFAAMYKSEEKLGSLLWIFTLMAIFIGCMGLFGLAAFSAEQRTKEIGIRKVLGASVFNIVGLLSKNFLLLVLVASLIAFPLAWWALNNWLEDFPYRITISWWVFVVAVVVALIIALITVSFQSIKAATANPVKSLRTE
jgi:putative ABC transport system permease protein